jgi:hypothetical protein
LASILPSCWKPFGINCHVSGCLLFSCFFRWYFLEIWTENGS